MKEITYRVVMSTPLGKRNGKLTVERNESVVKGKLNILGHSQPFEGKIDGAGNCSASGSFVTLMKEVEYTAVGVMTDEAVSLQIKCEGNHFIGKTDCFELTGVINTEKKELRV